MGQVTVQPSSVHVTCWGPGPPIGKPDLHEMMACRPPSPGGQSRAPAEAGSGTDGLQGWLAARVVCSRGLVLWAVTRVWLSRCVLRPAKRSSPAAAPWGLHSVKHAHLSLFEFCRTSASNLEDCHFCPLAFSHPDQVSARLLSQFVSCNGPPPSVKGCGTPG